MFVHVSKRTFAINMKIVYLILLFCESLQLQCDKAKVTAHVGEEFTIFCKYDTMYVYSKKYWCRGQSRDTCEIVADSERVKRHKSFVIDGGRRGLLVKVTDLQIDDTGVYWVGLDKIYADLMTPVSVHVTEVPVSKPRLWPLRSLVDRPTCWGQPVTVRCGCDERTGIHCAWYQRTQHKDFLLPLSPDLYLNCGTVEEDSDYYCVARNDISTQESEPLSVQVLTPAQRDCIYVVNMQDQPVYDCTDRMSTTMASTPPVATYEVKIHSTTRNQSLLINQTTQDPLLNRSGSHHFDGQVLCDFKPDSKQLFYFFSASRWLPLWYTLIRWGSLTCVLIFLCIVLTYTKTRKPKRRKTVHFKQMAHLAQ
uniref:uncharacterized protein LOC122777214 isoform X2 n=1 Tax=Solea senegalensis TaxID=28829 RepID=UPI001CD85321|nr:uncharacterized protein LOC122777214 isoform X2 [Solea senegalensis]